MYQVYLLVLSESLVSRALFAWIMVSCKARRQAKAMMMVVVAD